MRRILAVTIAGLFMTWASLPSAVAAEKCAEPGVADLKPGMKVITALAGPNWQVAKIDAMGKGRITVTSADGGKGSLSPRDVVPFPGATPPCFKKGDKVIAKVEKDIWRIATVSEVTEMHAIVIFPDRKKQSRTFSEIVRAPK
jgi:hypothetical protein